MALKARSRLRRCLGVPLCQCREVVARPATRHVCSRQQTRRSVAASAYKRHRVVSLCAINAFTANTGAVYFHLRTAFFPWTLISDGSPASMLHDPTVPSCSGPANTTMIHDQTTFQLLRSRTFVHIAADFLG